MQGMETVIQRQQRVTPEGDNHRLLSLGQDHGARLLRPGLHIFDRRSFAPLRNCLRVDAQLPAQLRERSLRSRYCCSDSVRGRGVAVTNLPHRASFLPKERIAPSNRGIKYLGPVVLASLRGETEERVSSIVSGQMTSAARG